MKTGYFNNSSKDVKLNSTQNSLDFMNTSKLQTIEDVIIILNKESRKCNNETIIINLLSELYNRVKETNLSESSKINSKTKIYILKCLYQFVEYQNERLLLEIARIILLVRLLQILNLHKIM